METSHIREFITLANLQNFMNAADELFISQSSLSKHIKMLETELGYPLFDRTTRKVQLSRFGKAYLPYAERIITLQEEGLNTLSHLSRDTDDSLRLGVLPVFTIYDIYEKLGSYRKKYNSHTLTLIEGSNDDLLRSLSDGRCNLVLIRHDDEGLPPQFLSIPFARDHLVLVLPHGHPLDDGRRTIRLDELDGMELMSSTSAYITRTLNRLTETAGVRVNLVTRLTHSEVVIDMVCRDRIPALLMRTPTEVRFGDRVVILDIEPAVTNTVSLVTLKHKPLNSAVRDFIRTLFPDWKEPKTHA